MKIHILGIAGSMSTPLALALQRQGHQITGSDQEKIYPPFSTMLSKNKIKVNTQPMDTSIDLIITNGAFNTFENTKKEFEESKKIGIPHLSATEYIAKYLIKKESILVSGSVGKTTTTAILSWIFLKLKLNPSYFVAGQFTKNIPSCQINDSKHSIVEAGEDFHGLETKAKFLYYPVKYLILTSAKWEHKDCYKTETDNLLAYQKLLEKLPTDGVLIYNDKDQDIQKILPFCKSKKISYVNQEFDTSLLGTHNQQNIAAAYTLCKYFGLNENKIINAIKSFPGVKLRLELISNTNNILFFNDFAQSADRIKTTILAIKAKYPHRNIYVILEPHAGFLQFKKSINELSNSFDKVSQIFLTKISFSKNLDKENRITFLDYKTIFGDNIKYLPMTSDLIDTATSILKSGDILIRFSSGGLDGQKSFHKIIKFFK
ncbi:MAG: Mur ligase family protein [Candidatus Shapirobacteria bacterium]